MRYGGPEFAITAIPTLRKWQAIYSTRSVRTNSANTCFGTDGRQRYESKRYRAVQRLRTIGGRCIALRRRLVRDSDVSRARTNSRNSGHHRRCFPGPQHPSPNVMSTAGESGRSPRGDATASAPPAFIRRCGGGCCCCCCCCCWAGAGRRVRAPYPILRAFIANLFTVVRRRNCTGLTFNMLATYSVSWHESDCTDS